MFAFTFPSLDPVKHATVINYFRDTCAWCFSFLSFSFLPLSYFFSFSFYLPYYNLDCGISSVCLLFWSGNFLCPQMKNILLISCFDLVLIENRFFRNAKEINCAYLLLRANCITISVTEMIILRRFLFATKTTLPSNSSVVEHFCKINFFPWSWKKNICLQLK